MSTLANLATWFLLFIIYSAVGWIFEVIVAIFTNRKLTNRGFLIGPICPIYGVGAILISLILGNVENVAAIFCVSMVGAVTLEYFTSWIMERLFHVRWWDYTDMPFNINGRVCLHVAVAFGILGVVIVRIANPLLFTALGSLSDGLLIAISSVLLGLIVIDLVASLWMILNFRVTVGTVERDATEEISERIRQIMMDKSHLSQRLVKAFPKFKHKRPAPRKRSAKAKKDTTANPKNH